MLCKIILSRVRLGISKQKFCFKLNIRHFSSNMHFNGIRENWNLKFTTEEFKKRTDELISSIRNVYDSVGKVPNDQVNYNTVLKLITDAECEYASKRYILDQSQHFSPDENIRNASVEADKILRAFDVELSMRQDIFEKFVILEKQKENLKPEFKRFLEKHIIDGKRNGLHLPEETQKKVKDLKNKIDDLCIQFTKNLADESTTLEFSTEELNGLPNDFIDNLKKLDNGKHEVSLKYPDYIPIMEKCRNSETRRKMYLAFNSRCIKENNPILHELVKLRHEQANLLGYSRHCDYVTEILMSKSGDNVMQFLNELWEKLKPLWEEEKNYLLTLKEKECNELNVPFDGLLHPYDLKFYTTKMELIKCAVDHSKLKEYFPLSTVTEGLCHIYQKLLGLTFKEVKNAEVWHEDVQLFSVEDSSTGALIGYFYLDLHPRTGKYSHACMLFNQPGCLLPDGTRQVAVGTMLTNFTKPQKDKPSLLDHDEVVTFFHEFGHLMHYICIENDLAHCEGLAIETDFIEAPSQMLENWCWEIAPLKIMSKHYLTKEEIPQELLSALINSRSATAGSFTLRQIVLALSDLKIHSCSEDNIKKVFKDTFWDVMGIEETEDTFMACSFGHLCGGYDSRYYGYLWSNVFCMDMFYTHFKDGKVLDPTAGKDYRNKILKPGTLKDAMDLLVDFLGRQPTQDAFLLSQGLKI